MLELRVNCLTTEVARITLKSQLSFTKPLPLSGILSMIEEMYQQYLSNDPWGHSWLDKIEYDKYKQANLSLKEVATDTLSITIST